MTSDDNRRLNARKETADNFDAILLYTKPRPTALDLLDHIISEYINNENIPIKDLLKKLKETKKEVIASQ